MACAKSKNREIRGVVCRNISHEPNGQSEFPKSADEGRRGTREEEEGGGREMSRRDEQEKEWKEETEEAEKLDQEEELMRGGGKSQKSEKARTGSR